MIYALVVLLRVNLNDSIIFFSFHGVVDFTCYTTSVQINYQTYRG